MGVLLTARETPKDLFPGVPAGIPPAPAPLGKGQCHEARALEGVLPPHVPCTVPHRPGLGGGGQGYV